MSGKNLPNAEKPGGKKIGKKKKQLLTPKGEKPARRKRKNEGRTNLKTRDKPQRIVAQRLLSRVQYPDPTKSSAKDLSNRAVSLQLTSSNI